MRKFIVRVLLFLPAAVGCTDDDSFAGFEPVRIGAVIEASAEEVRTGMNGSKASFIANDKIGIFEILTGVSNAQCTYSGTAWSFATPIYWRDGVSTHTFYAYYPYKASASGSKVSIPVLSTQTVSTTPSPAADLLVAGPQSQIRTPDVGLTFRHAFALIQLNVKIGILGLLNPYDLSSITISGGNPATSFGPYGIFNVTGTGSDVGYDLIAGAVQADNNTADRFARSATFNISGISLLTTAVTIYIFVLPGTYTTPQPAVSFRVSLLGAVSVSSTSNFSNTTFQAGIKYSYDVSIGRLLAASEYHTTLDLCEMAAYD